MIVTALPSITASLHGETTQGFWISASYVLSSAIFQPLFASLSNIFGHVQILAPSVLLFSLGALTAGLSRGYHQLLAGRIVQGVGAAGIMSLSLIAFTDVVPMKARPSSYALLQGAYAVGLAAGPVVGGVVAEVVSWKGVFLLNLPVCFLALAAVLPLGKGPTAKGGIGQKMKRIDWVGAGLLIASLSSFLIAVSRTGNERSRWFGLQALVPLLAGLGGLVLMWGWERSGVVQEPILRPATWYWQTGRIAYLCAIVQGFLLYTQLHYIPLYFLAIPGSSPTSSGMHLLPLLFALLAASVAASNAIMRTNRYQRILAAGLALVTLTCGIATQLDLTGNTTSAGLRDGLLLLNGVGHGCILNSLNLTPLANAHSSTEQAGGDGLAHAAAAYSFLRALGTCLAICICGPVFETLLLHRLTQFQLPAPIAQHSIEFAIQLQTLPDSWVSKRQVKISYLYSLRGVFGLLAAGAGIALLEECEYEGGAEGDAGDSKTPRTPDARFDRLPKSPTAEWNWRPQGPVEERPRS
ncbi:hypothetical protein H2203_001186 [Taxawa tesnikishii (nom. ined.)]|nr:hypothetical protein H2203_001186 [Dothideales sp. JES 119]